MNGPKDGLNDIHALPMSLDTADISKKKPVLFLLISFLPQK